MHLVLQTFFFRLHFFLGTQTTGSGHGSGSGQAGGSGHGSGSGQAGGSGHGGGSGQGSGSGHGGGSGHDGHTGHSGHDGHDGHGGQRTSGQERHSQLHSVDSTDVQLAQDAQSDSHPQDWHMVVMD